MAGLAEGVLVVPALLSGLLYVELVVGLVYVELPDEDVVLVLTSSGGMVLV